MKRFLVIISTSILFFDCNKNIVFNDYVRIGETEGWARNVPIKFEVEIQDTISSHDFYVNVRQATGYPYSNLFLELSTQYPDKKMEKDTLECVLANERGEWLGNGAGDLWDNKILFKKNLKFPNKGKYTFTFTQGMRLDPLPLILDVGMSLEKSKTE